MFTNSVIHVTTADVGQQLQQRVRRVRTVWPTDRRSLTQRQGHTGTPRVALDVILDRLDGPVRHGHHVPAP